MLSGAVIDTRAVERHIRHSKVYLRKRLSEKWLLVQGSYFVCGDMVRLLGNKDARTRGML